MSRKATSSFIALSAAGLKYWPWITIDSCFWVSDALGGSAAGAACARASWDTVGAKQARTSTLSIQASGSAHDGICGISHERGSAAPSA